MSRNYADFNHDYGGFMIDNNWDFEIFDVKGTSCDLKFDYRHKQFRYPYVANPYDFHQNFVASEVQLSKRDDWKLIAADEIRFYNFPAKHSNDKIYYILRVSAEKFLFKKSVTAGFDYRYVFKNFLHKLDITENVFRGRLSCRW
jgi:hypothetical protein